MGRLESKHWAVIGGFLIAIGTMIAGLDHWADLTRPGFVAGLLGLLGAQISAIFIGAPPNPNLNPVVNPGRREDDPIPPKDIGTVTDTTRRNLR